MDNGLNGWITTTSNVVTSSEEWDLDYGGIIPNWPDIMPYDSSLHNSKFFMR